MSVGNYTISYQLGSGNNADVFAALHTQLSIPVAIKQIPKENMKLDEQVKKQTEREIDILKHIRHRNVIELFEVVEDDKNFYLVMELAANGNLCEHLSQQTMFSMEDYKKIFRQICDAVYYLHKVMNIAHRDIKLENILFDESMNAKLADFGLSTFDFDGLLTTPCGSPAFVAPEVIIRQPYSKAADIWSLGVCLYLLVCGSLPFESDSITVLIKKIVTVPVSIPEYLSKDLRNLLAKMLEKNPTNRITIDEIMVHPWLCANNCVKNNNINNNTTNSNGNNCNHITDSISTSTPDQFSTTGTSNKGKMNDVLSNEMENSSNNYQKTNNNTDYNFDNESEYVKKSRRASEAVPCLGIRPFLSADISQQASNLMILQDPDDIDYQIIDFLIKNFNVDEKTLKHNIKNNVFNPETAMYRILRKTADSESQQQQHQTTRASASKSQAFIALQPLLPICRKRKNGSDISKNVAHMYTNRPRNFTLVQRKTVAITKNPRGIGLPNLFAKQ